MDKESQLRLFSEEIRVTTLKMLEKRGSGHVGGCMSIVEMTAVLYGGIMRINPEDPNWPDRDMFVLSKGHAGPTLYSALALRGFFPAEWLDTLNNPGTMLPSHCDKKTPGVDMTTGSLGQGISMAIGLAIAQRMNHSGARTFLCVGDGECNEGQIWEGVMLASHKKLDNLIIFCDKNGLQLDGYTKDVLDMGDISAKFKSFGAYTQTIDGHNVAKVWEACEKAIANTGSPSVIVLETEKGHGCTFAVGHESNHHMVFDPGKTKEAMEYAQKALEDARLASERSLLS